MVKFVGIIGKWFFYSIFLENRFFEEWFNVVVRVRGKYRFIMFLVGNMRVFNF